MKKFVSICVLLCFFACAAAAEITLMSFNLAHLKRQGAEGYDEWAKTVCAVIKEAKADVVLLQEVPIELEKTANPLFKRAKKNNVLDDFAKMLGSGWLYCSTANYAIRKNMEVGGESYVYCDMNQNNAMLYDSKKVLARDLAEQVGFAKFDGKYLFDKNNVQAVEFRVSGAESEKFVAINIHAPFNNLEHRSRDLATLEKLYASLKMRSAVIIAGDFNTPRKELKTRNFDGVDGEDSFFSDRNFGLKTTLSSKGEGIALANDYDHFIYSKKVNVVKSMRRAFVQGKEARLDSYTVGERTFLTSAELKKSLSDHLPIVLEISL